MEKVHHFMSLQSIMYLMSGFTPSIFLYVKVDLGLVEEDSEFEEFSVDSVKAAKKDKKEDPAMRNLWKNI